MLTQSFNNYFLGLSRLASLALEKMGQYFMLLWMSNQNNKLQKAISLTDIFFRKLFLIRPGPRKTYKDCLEHGFLYAGLNC